MTVTETNRSGLVGQSVSRVEDVRLLQGGGTYVADVNPPGVLHAAFLRSPLPHATITSIDVEAARRAPGVAAVFTGADIEATTHPFVPLVTERGLYTPPYYGLSAHKVRHVGDPIALVLAESRHLAEDAVQLIDVEFEPLTPVASISDALHPDTAPLWEKADGNVLYEHNDTHGDVESVFAAADRVITERFTCPRQSNQPMETRGTVIEVDPDTGRLTVHTATQAAQMVRWTIAALAAKRPVTESLRAIWSNKERRKNFGAAAKQFFTENAESMKKADNTGMRDQLKRDRSMLKVMNQAGIGLLGADTFPHVKAQDIGGGFGSKGSFAREDLALAAAAIQLARSVKWIEDRTENLMDGGQAREEHLTMSVAVDDDGTFRGLRVGLDLDQGAYPGFPFAGIIAERFMHVMFPGSYRWDAYELNSRFFATNKGKY
ncbi:MAG: xanthine dehydrogenase family protein molybdopterin-binding subunit, partial [Ilumatobacteraceae bacterium]